MNSKKDSPRQASSPSKPLTLSPPDELSEAQIIFRDKALLVKRPEEMKYNEYKILQRIQSEVMKRLFHKGHSSSRKIAQKMPRSRFGNLLPAVSLTDYLRYLQPKIKENGIEK